MSDVFISYSRKDGDFAQRLTNALAKSSRDVWIDWEDIPRAADWLHEIYTGIEEADTFLFIVSPQSLVSEICNYEIAHARQHHKRIIVLIRQDIDAESEKQVAGEWFNREWETLARENWAALKHLNWIFFTDDARFEAEFTALVTTLEQDLAHIRAHKRYLVRALEWERGGRNDSALLIGDEIDAAESWLRDAAAKDPTPTTLQNTFIEQSCIVENQRQARLQRLRRASLGLGIMVVIAAAATIFAALQASSALTQVDQANATLTPARQIADDSQTQAAQAADEVAAANATLTPIPVTLTSVAQAIDRQQNRLQSFDLAIAAQDVLARGNPDFLALPLALAAAANDNHPITARRILAEIAYAPGVARHFTGFDEAVFSVALSPDDALISADGCLSPDGFGGCAETAIHLLDADSGALLRTIDEGLGGARTIQFSPDGTTLVAGGENGRVRLWNVTDGSVIKTLQGHRGPVIATAFDPTGSVLASASEDGAIALWRTDDYAFLRELKGGPDLLAAMAFSPDGRTLAAGGDSATIDLWDVDTGEPIATLNGGMVWTLSLAFNPAGDLLAAGTGDGDILLWNVATETLAGTITAHRDGVRRLAFAPDGDMLASGSLDTTIMLWHLWTGGEADVLEGHSGPILGLAFDATGQFLLSGSADGRLIRWDVRDGRLREALTGHSQSVMSVGFSADGGTLASLSTNTELIVWDADTGQSRATFGSLPDIRSSAAFSADGQWLAGSSFDDQVFLIDVNDGAQTAPFDGAANSILSIAISPDNQLIATGGFVDSFTGEVILWDVANQALSARLGESDGHEGAVETVAFSPDGRLLASGSSDRTVKLWDVESRALVMTLQGPESTIRSLAFSPDGNLLAAGSADGTVWLWDTASGDLRMRLTEHTDAVTAVIFSPDGGWLATGSLDNTAKLWDVASGEVIVTYDGFRDGLAFSPDGQLLAAGGFNQAVNLWRVDGSAGELIAWTCQHRDVRDLTTAEQRLYDVAAVNVCG